MTYFINKQLYQNNAIYIIPSVINKMFSKTPSLSNILKVSFNYVLSVLKLNHDNTLSYFSHFSI